MTRSKQIKSVFLTTLMVLSVFSMSGIAFSGTAVAEETDDQFTQVTDDLTVWERSVLPLRADTDDAATTIDNHRMQIIAPDGEQVDANRDDIGVFEGPQIDLTYRGVSGANTDSFADEPGQLVVASFEENRDTGNVAAADDLGELLDLALEGDTETLREEATDRNITFEIVAEEDPLFDGVGEFDQTIETDESGPYAVIAATGQGLAVDEDGMLEVEGESTIVGVELLLVQDGSSSMELPETVAPGNDITVDASSSLSGDLSHTVLVYDEEAFLDEQTRINVTEGTISNLSSEDITIEHSIDEVNGVGAVTDDGPVFGNEVVSRTITGTTPLGDVLDQLNDEAETDFQRESIGSAVLDASATVVPDASDDEEISVGTYDNWSEGTYQVVHIVEDGTVQGLQTSTETIEVAEAPAFFDVEIDETNAPIDEGETLEVDATIENTGSEPGAQNIQLDIDGTVKDSVDVELEGGESEAVSLAWDTEVGENGTYDATVSSDDDSATEEVRIRDLESPFFEVTIDEEATDDAIDPGDVLNVTAEVENTGETASVQDISLVIDADRSFRETVDSEEVTIEGGETETVELSFETDEQTRRGNRTLEVRSADDDDRAEFRVRAANLTLPSVVPVDPPVAEGVTLPIDITVENIGDLEEPQTVEIYVNGDLIETREVTLAPGLSEVLETEYETQPGDAPNIEITAITPDDELIEDATVEASNFEVNITNAEPTGALVEDEDTLTVTAEIENTGELDDEQRITFVAGDSAETRDVELEGAESTEETFTYDIETGDAPGFEASVSSSDDSDSINVTVLEDQFFEIEIDESASDDAVEQGAEYSLVAWVNNTGGEEGTQDITFDFGQDGVDLTEDDVTLDPDENTTISFDFTVPEDADPGTTFAEVASEDDGDSTTTTVEEPPEPATFAIDVLEDDSRLDIVSGSTAQVVVEVENTGDLPGDATITTTTDADDPADVMIDELDGGESTTETIRIETDDDLLDPDDPVTTFDVDLETDDDTASTELSVSPPPEEAYFDVDVIDSNAPVVEGETLELTVEVENRGDIEATQPIELLRDGSVIEAEDVTLDGGDTQTISFDVDTEVGDAPDVSLTVQSEDADSSTTQDLNAVAEFEVDIVDTNDPIAHDEQLEVTVDVENIGDVAGDDTLEVVLGSNTEEVEITGLAGGDVTTETVSIDAESGADRVFASTSDDLDAKSVDINDPASYEVDIVEAFSDLEVVEGDTATITVDIENDGGIEDTQDVTIDIGSQTETIEDIELEPGEFTIEEVTLDTDPLAPGSYTITATNDDGDTFEADDEFVVLEAADFQTNIETVNGEEPPLDSDTPRDAFEEGSTLEVDVNATNFGEEEETKTLRITRDGETIATESVTLADESDTITFDVDTDVGDAPETELLVTLEETADPDDVVSSDELDVPLFAVAEFEPTITSVDDEIDDESSFDVTISVENVGDFEDSQTVELSFNGDEVDNTSVRNLDAGDTRTVTLTVPEDNVTDAGVGDAIVEAITDDDSDVQRVSIGEAANYEIDEIATNDPVIEGDEFTVDLTVTNTGDVEGDQNLVLFIDGDREDIIRNVELDPDGETTETLTYETDGDDVGTPDFTVDTEDETAEDTFEVLADATFETEIVAISSGIDDDDVDAVTDSAFDVIVEVENTGDVSGTDELELYIDDASSPTDTVSVDVSADDATTASLEHVPTDAGELDLEVIGSDDSDTETIDIGTPGELEIEFDEVTDPVTADETLDVDVELENVGDIEITETATFTVETEDGDELDTQTETETVAGDDTETVSFQYEVDEEQAEDLVVTVEAGSETIDTTVEVIELDDALFRVTSLDAPDEVLQIDGESFEVNATVTNIGELDGEQTIELLVDGDVIDEETLDLDAGVSEEVAFDLDADSLSVGDREIAIESEDRQRNTTVTVREPEDPDLRVSIDDAPDDLEQGELLTVDVDVENTGDLSATAESIEFELLVDGTVIASDSDTVSLDGGESTTVTLSDTVTPQPKAGVFDGTIDVESPDDSADTGVEVDFGSIQSGVDAATEGDTVLVADGWYTERVVIETDDVTLESTDRTANIRPRIGDEAIAIRADDVTVNGFRMIGAGDRSAINVDGDAATISRTQIVNWETGIKTESGGDHEISRASVFNTDVGIHLQGDGDNLIRFSRIAGSDRGLIIEADNTRVTATLVAGSNRGITILPVPTSAVNPTYDVDIEESELRSNAVGLQAENAEDVTQSFDVSQTNLEGNDVSLVSNVVPNSTPVDATENYWGDGGAGDADVIDREGGSTDTSQELDEPVTDPDFQVTLDSIDPDPVDPEETVSVEATVENFGDRSGAQDIELEVDGDVVDDTEIELSGGVSDAVTLEFEPSIRDGGDDLSIAVASDDDAVDGTVSVNAPADFTAEITDTPDEVEAGDTIGIEAEIENIGGPFENEHPAELRVDGETVDSETVVLDSGADTTVDLEYETDDADVGELTIEIAAQDGTDTATVTVTEAPEDPDPSTGTGTTPSPTPDPDPEVVDPDEVDPPADVEPERAEQAPIEIDDETGLPSVTFTEESTTESITFADDDVEGEVTVEDYDTESEETGPSPGASVSVTRITVPDPDRSATIRTRISTERLEQVDADADELRMNRFSDGEWQGLETEVVDETDQGVVLEAETPGFSWFSVSAVSQPEATFDVTPAQPEVGDEVTFDASDSDDRHGEITSYEWSINGEELTGETVTYTFDDADEFDVTLTVENDAGETDSEQRTVTMTEESVPGPDPEPEPEPEPVEEPGALSGLTIAFIGVLLITVLAAVLWVRRQQEN